MKTATAGMCPVPAPWIFLDHDYWQLQPDTLAESTARTLAQCTRLLALALAAGSR